MKNVLRVQVDTTDEICKVFNNVIDNLNQIEGKVLQLTTANDAYNAEVDKYNETLLTPKKKPKKKGFTMIKTMVSIIIVLAMTVACFGYVASDINYDIASNPQTLQQYLRDTVGAGTYVFTPIAAPTGIDIIEGKQYYDVTARAMYYSNDGATWTLFEAGTAVSLDGAYNVGSTIDVDTSAVTMTTSNADNNVVLAIVQNEADNDNDALTITFGSNAIGSGILINSQSGGTDITGDNWSVSQAGVPTIISLVLENGGIINNTTDNEIEFIENSEEFSFAFNGNTLTYATDTGIDTIAFGVLDDLSGINNIAFDDAASTITLTSTGATDLTISQATADQDASLILQSSGTGTDALSLISSVGDIKIASADNIDIDAADNIAVDTAGGTFVLTTVGGDITVDASDKSVVIRGSEAAADAILFDVDNAAGGIDINAGTGNIDIDITTGDFLVDCDLVSIDGTGTSNITFTNGAAEDVTISTAGAADHSLIIQTTGTAADSFQIITTAGGIDITNGGAAGGEDIDVDAVLASLNLNADEDVADAVTIAASTGGIDITADGAAAKDLDLVCTNGSTNLSGGEADAAAVTIAAGAGGMTLDTAATFDIIVTATGGRVQVTASEAVGDQFKVDATGAVAGNAINFETTNGGILLNADGANGNIGVDAAVDLTLTAAGDLALAVTGNVTGAILGDGSDIFQGYLHGIEIEAGVAEQLLIADSGKVFANTAAQGATTFTLPDAAAGLIYYFVDNSSTPADDVIIDCAIGDNIDHDTAGDAIESVTDAYPQTIILVALNGTDWATMGVTGTWGQQ